MSDFAGFDRRITIEQAAELLSCNPKTIRRAIDAGLLPAVRLRTGRGKRGALRVRFADVEEWLASGAVEPKPVTPTPTRPDMSGIRIRPSRGGA